MLASVSYAGEGYTTDSDQYDVRLTGGQVQVSTILKDPEFAKNKGGTQEERAEHWTNSTYANDGSIFFGGSAQGDVTFVVDESIYVWQLAKSGDFSSNALTIKIDEDKELQLKTALSLSNNATLTLSDGSGIRTNGDITFANGSSADNRGSSTLNIGSGVSVTWGKAASIKMGNNNNSVINYTSALTGNGTCITLEGVCELGNALTINASIDAAALNAAADKTLTTKLFQLGSYSGRSITLGDDSTLNLTGWNAENYLGVLTLNGSTYTDTQGQTVDLSAIEGPYYALVKGQTGSDIKSLSIVAHLPEPATATLSLLALVGLAARRRRH